MRIFDQIVDATVRWSGSPTAVVASFGLVAVWALFGPVFGWSEGHQLFINTVTTILTFWLAFLILAAQNRDTLAIHVKLDALIKSSEANNAFIALERLSRTEIEEARSRDGLAGPT